MKRKLLPFLLLCAGLLTAHAAPIYPHKVIAGATNDVDQDQYDPAQDSITFTNLPGGGRRAIHNIIGSGGPGGTNIVLLAEPGVLLTSQGTGTNGIGADFSAVVSNGGFTINITGGSTGAVANGGSITIPSGGGLSADQTKALIASNATTFTADQTFRGALVASNGIQLVHGAFEVPGVFTIDPLTGNLVTMGGLSLAGSNVTAWTQVGAANPNMATTTNANAFTAPQTFDATVYLGAKDATSSWGFDGISSNGIGGLNTNHLRVVNNQWTAWPGPGSVTDMLATASIVAGATNNATLIPQLAAGGVATNAPTAHQFYIDIGAGSDATANPHDQLRPCKTLLYAFTNSAPFDVWKIRAGTYNLNGLPTILNTTNNLTISGDEYGDTIFTNSASSQSLILGVSNTVENINFAGPTQYQLKFGAWTTIRNCKGWGNTDIIGGGGSITPDAGPNTNIMEYCEWHTRYDAMNTLGNTGCSNSWWALRYNTYSLETNAANAPVRGFFFNQNVGGDVSFCTIKGGLSAIPLAGNSNALAVGFEATSSATLACTVKVSHCNFSMLTGTNAFACVGNDGTILAGKSTFIIGQGNDWGSTTVSGNVGLVDAPVVIPISTWGTLSAGTYLVSPVAGTNFWQLLYNGTNLFVTSATSTTSGGSTGSVSVVGNNVVVNFQANIINSTANGSNLTNNNGVLTVLTNRFLNYIGGITSSNAGSFTVNGTVNQTVDVYSTGSTLSHGLTNFICGGLTNNGTLAWAGLTGVGTVTAGASLTFTNNLTVPITVNASIRITTSAGTGDGGEASLYDNTTIQATQSFAVVAGAGTGSGDMSAPIGLFVFPSDSWTIVLTNTISGDGVVYNYSLQGVW